MRMDTVWGAVIGALLVGGETATAQPKAPTPKFAQGLYDLCHTETSHPYSATYAGVCAGYIVGSVAMMAALDATGKYDACLPDAVTGLQYRDVVTKYLRDHPEKRHLASVLVIATAIDEAFCQPSRPK